MPAPTYYFFRQDQTVQPGPIAEIFIRIGVRLINSSGMFLDKLKETLEPLTATCSMCLHCFSEITIHNPGSCNNTTAAYLLKLEGIGEAGGLCLLIRFRECRATLVDDVDVDSDEYVGACL
jgi:hypothetical protein